MRKKFYIFFITIIAASIHANAQWIDLGSHFPDTINTACLPDIFCFGDTLWIPSCTNANVLYYSTNGGMSFAVNPTPAQFNAVHFLSPTLGYAASQDGLVYKTVDAGSTWTIHGLAGSAAYNITFPPHSDTGWVCGYWGHIHQVTPAGVSPNFGVFTSSMMSLSFPDAEHGWICGGVIIQPYQNNAWGGNQTYSFGGWNDIFFINDSIGWAVGDFIYASTGLIHTTNGADWISDANPVSEGCYAILFLNELEGWVGSYAGTVLHSTDGGNTWYVDNAVTALTNHRFITEMFYVPSKQSFYILGNKGLLLKNGSVNQIPHEVDGTNGFRIFPNPSRDILTMQFDPLQNLPRSFSIVNLPGVRVKEYRVTGVKQQINVRELPEGSYVVMFTDSETRYTGKLIVLR